MMERVTENSQEREQHRQRPGALKGTAISLKQHKIFQSLIREVLEGIQVLNTFFSHEMMTGSR